MTYFYLIENCLGDINKVYIGKTKIEGSRKNKHKTSFGKDIICTTIDFISSNDKKDWKPLESFYINYFKFLGFDVQNKNEGGGGCVKASLSMRMKISEKNKGKVRTEEHKQNYRGPKSEEHKKNMSLCRLGKPSPKKGKKSGPNLKLKLNKERNQKISNWASKNKEKLRLDRLGKNKKGCKILDVVNNIIFDSKVLCAKYHSFNINKMRKLVDENIYFKKLK